MMPPRAMGWIPPEMLGRAPHVGARSATPGGLDALRQEVFHDHLPPIYDQHSVGSCTAQSTAAAVETMLVRSGYPAQRPDRAKLYRRGRDRIGRARDDSGASLADVVDILRHGWEAEVAEPPSTFGGVWTEWAPDLAADAPRIVNAEALDFDVLTIATEIDAGHIPVIGLSITESWFGASGKKSLPPPSGPSVGRHAVELVGYSIPARSWVTRNSWGRTFGVEGYILLPWEWTEPPWCGEIISIRAVRRAS